MQGRARGPSPRRKTPNARRRKDWFETAKRLRTLLSTLESLGLEIAEADPRWER